MRTGAVGLGRFTIRYTKTFLLCLFSLAFFLFFLFSLSFLFPFLIFFFLSSRIYFFPFLLFCIFGFSLIFCFFSVFFFFSFVLLFLGLNTTAASLTRGFNFTKKVPYKLVAPPCKKRALPAQHVQDQGV